MFLRTSSIRLGKSAPSKSGMVKRKKNAIIKIKC
nr:MAG TPA: hypothetical protein [Caudoviricetes sp.]